jgi:hypothetical protein
MNKQLEEIAVAVMELQPLDAHTVSKSWERLDLLLKANKLIGDLPNRGVGERDEFLQCVSMQKAYYALLVATGLVFPKDKRIETLSVSNHALVARLGKEEGLALLHTVSPKGCVQEELRRIVVTSPKKIGWGWKGGEVVVFGENLKKTVSPSVTSKASEDKRVKSFLDTLRFAIQMKQAHVLDKYGNLPVSAHVWGCYASEHTGDYLTPGLCIGWVDRNNLYLNPDVAMDCARNFGFKLLQRETYQLLYKEGLLLSTCVNTPLKCISIRKVLAGKRQRVLHLSASRFLEEESKKIASPVPTIQEPPTKEPSAPVVVESPPKEEEKVSHLSLTIQVDIPYSAIARIVENHYRTKTDLDSLLLDWYLKERGGKD